MSWDEKLFGVLYRAVRGSRRDEPPAEAAHLEPRRGGLALVASAVARRRIELRAAERDGHREGDTLFLPELIALAPTPALNARAYLVRVALDATMVRLGLEPARPLGGAARRVFSLLALPAALTALEQDLPGARATFDELAPHALARRPPFRGGGSAAVVELFARRLLGAPPTIEASLGREVALRARALAEIELRDGLALTDAAIELARGLDERDLAPVVLVGATAYAKAPRAATASGDAALPDATGTERRGKTREDVRRVKLDDSPKDDNPLVHSFEKVHTAEEYGGGRKHVDGSDEMGEHGDALDELEMHTVVRSHERARSLYRAEVTFGDTDAGDVASEACPDGGLPYDEWDERTHGYRKGHCRVFATEARPAADPLRALGAARAIVGASARSVREIEERFERIERARRPRGRQPDGAEIDVDAMVARHAALAAGRPGEDRLYIASRPRVSELAVLVLVDASLSSDAWIDGRRLLDVAKHAVLVLGEALTRLGLRLGVAAFSSNTRRDCRFAIVKRFDEGWESGVVRLAGVVPTAYTRIGPALRHGAHLLEGTGARKKLLLMIGDGKPTDFDRYEGRYGIADVHKAVEDAAQRGVHTFALATDATARRHLPRMFGPHGFEVVANPQQIAPALGRVCAELA